MTHGQKVATTFSPGYDGPMWVGVSLYLLLSASSGTALAQPTAPAPQPAPTASPTKRKKRREVKETEGSVAPGRFEAETILKSQYHLDGQQLEVDPD